MIVIELLALYLKYFKSSKYKARSVIEIIRFLRTFLDLENFRFIDTFEK